MAGKERGWFESTHFVIIRTLSSTSESSYLEASFKVLA